MLSLLPSTLLALLFASPVFAEPTSQNDPFRAISLKVPKQPENPICCLKPLTPLEPVEDEILLSFEEWKLKQLAMQAESVAKPKEKEGMNHSSSNVDSSGGGDANGRNESSISTPDAASGPPIVQAPSEPADVSPHFRVPMTDRFNYASLDCSARVQGSHRSAKSASSILSSKKDRYLLSPCNTPKERQFVVVELCDDIRIDTVQVANFEFFSGVFKDFTVSVAKTYTSNDEGWTLAGTYRAKNARGVQSFHPPTTLRDFYRYIRIDFLSHYGNEYYCPISLLRVYGLTHLEQWKWDIWEAESRAKQAELGQGKPPVLPVVEIVTETAPTTNNVPPASSDEAEVAERSGASTITSQPPNETGTVVQQQSDIKSSPSTLTAESASSNPSHTSSLSPIPNTSATAETHNPQPSAHDTDDSHSNFIGTPVQSTKTPSSSSSESSSISNPTLSLSPKASSLTNSTTSKHTVSHTPPPTSNLSPPAHSTASIIVSASSPSVAVIPIPLPPAPNGGESIYRTIMNRLTAVETNHTLYLRYIEQQNGVIRDVIKRLGEDLGRLEGISRAQNLMFQRKTNDWDKQRYQLQLEYGDIIERIEHLSEEIILEKRLGVAQLCLLLAVLVFLGLTRGSRAEVSPGPKTIRRSMREWGKRHLSLSGDWAAPFKRKDSKSAVGGRTSRSSSTSRARTPPPHHRPKPLSIKSYPPDWPNHFQESDNMIAFPSSSRLPQRKEPLEPVNMNLASIPNERHQRSRTRTTSGPRSRNPSLRSTPVTRRTQHTLQRPITPTRLVFRPPALQRSNSHGLAAVSITQSTSWGGGGNSLNAPKSAKKWARTAHLHEVKQQPASAGAGTFRRLAVERDRTPREFEFGIGKERAKGDVFSSSQSIASSASPPLAGSGSDRTIAVGFLTEDDKQTLGDSLLLKPEGDVNGAITSVEDGDPWVDTDSVDDNSSSELGHDSMTEPILEISSSPVLVRSAIPVS